MKLANFTNWETREQVSINPDHVAAVIEVTGSKRPATDIILSGSGLSYRVEGDYQSVVDLLRAAV